MKSKKNNYKNKKYNNIILQVVAFLLVTAALIGLIHEIKIVYGKYYAARHNKGITVASNLYFSSDKLRQSTGKTNLQELMADTASINQISVFSNTGSWISGATTMLTFEIRNFHNSILYNDSNLDIEYTIEFVLLDEPDGATYSVVDSNSQKHPLTQKGTPVVIQGVTIKGGNVKAHTYGIEIVHGGGAYNPSRVLVMAYPTNPSYIHREPGTDHEYRLLGIFEGHQTDVELTIESKGFKVQNVTGYSDTGWKEKVQDLLGYIYNFKTAGDVITDANINNDNADKVIVSWDNRYLTIDKYDENYLHALELNAEASSHGLPEDYYVVEGDKTSMVILTLPYASIDMTFYKTAEFNSELASKSANKAGRQWFESLVDVKLAKDVN